MGVTSAEPVAHSPGLDAVQSLLIPGERLEFSAIQHRACSRSPTGASWSAPLPAD